MKISHIAARKVQTTKLSAANKSVQFKEYTGGSLILIKFFFIHITSRRNKNIVEKQKGKMNARKPNVLMVEFMERKREKTKLLLQLYNHV